MIEIKDFSICVKSRKFDGAGDIIFNMYGADKEVIKWVIEAYARPGYEISILPEIEETEKGSEQQRWLEGK